MDPTLDKLFTVSLNDLEDYRTGEQATISISSPNTNNTVIGGGYYTAAQITSGSGYNWPNVSSPWATSTGTNTQMAGRLNLTGENADLIINGISLMEVLQDRLNIMVPNPQLEKEWEQLKKLGDKYRKLEKKLKEQGEMWSKLKAMPPPDMK